VRGTTRRSLLRYLYVLLALSLLAACGGGSGTESGGTTAAGDASAPPAAGADTSEAAPAAEPASVRFALPVSPPDEGQIWAFVPSGAGFFEEENLEVEFLPSDGGTAALTSVATGDADFSVSNPQALINGVAEGLDVRGVATVIPRQIYGFYVLPGSDIQDYEDLRGKRVGISSFTSGSYPFAQSALSEKGLNPDSDVEFVTTDAGAPALAALQSGDVDVLATWDTQVAVFGMLGQELRQLPETSVAQLPADLITTRTDLLESDPDVVARFARAVLKGIAYANERPEDALAMFQEQFPDAAAGAEDPQESLVVLEARVETMQPSEAQDGWGDIPLDQYEQLQEIGLETEVIEQPQDLSEIMVTDLLPEIQEFDPEAVAQ
jgi:NitT/TauT family transport system substrate-binding protein